MEGGGGKCGSEVCRGGKGGKGNEAFKTRTWEPSDVESGGGTCVETLRARGDVRIEERTPLLEMEHVGICWKVVDDETVYGRKYVLY